MKGPRGERGPFCAGFEEGQYKGLSTAAAKYAAFGRDDSVGGGGDE